MLPSPIRLPPRSLPPSKPDPEPPAWSPDCLPRISIANRIVHPPQPVVTSLPDDAHIISVLCVPGSFSKPISTAHGRPIIEAFLFEIGDPVTGRRVRSSIWGNFYRVGVESDWSIWKGRAGFEHYCESGLYIREKEEVEYFRGRLSPVWRAYMRLNASVAAIVMEERARTIEPKDLEDPDERAFLTDHDLVGDVVVIRRSFRLQGIGDPTRIYYVGAYGLSPPGRTRTVQALRTFQPPCLWLKSVACDPDILITPSHVTIRSLVGTLVRCEVLDLQTGEPVHVATFDDASPSCPIFTARRGEHGWTTVKHSRHHLVRLSSDRRRVSVWSLPKLEILFEDFELPILSLMPEYGTLEISPDGSAMAFVTETADLVLFDMIAKSVGIYQGLGEKDRINRWKCRAVMSAKWLEDDVTRGKWWAVFRTRERRGVLQAAVMEMSDDAKWLGGL
ncbi:hypothetical protein HK101_000494 [Irineochytrium annulatum]|nr:hypothetical protein HK101_000494 [Irineochytrium annulatum]